jgi:hypothetical protein
MYIVIDERATGTKSDDQMTRYIKFLSNCKWLSIGSTHSYVQTNVHEVSHPHFSDALKQMHHACRPSCVLPSSRNRTIIVARQCIKTKAILYIPTRDHGIRYVRKHQILLRPE